jgi:alpha-beta hydrolase superfamily lysophospholipase
MPSPEMPDARDLQAQLANAVTMAAEQYQIGWEIYSVFGVSNAVLLVALFATGALRRPVGLVVSAAGLALSLVWSFIQFRAVAWLTVYENIIFNIENELFKTSPSFALSQTRNRQEVGGLSIRWMVIGSPVLAAVFWAVAVFFFYLYARPGTSSGLHLEPEVFLR